MTTLGSAWRVCATEVLDALYPPRCWLCDAPRGADPFSCDAHAFLPAARVPRCERCARMLPLCFPDGGVCAECRARPLRLRRALTLATYTAGEPLREWILAFKHGDRRDLAHVLGRALGAHFVRSVASQADVLLVPVPIHWGRRLVRGYDQARLLAREVAQFTGADVRDDLLVRRRATPAQGSLAAGTRQGNVRAAFACDLRAAAIVRERSVWLVDDVATSGATLAAAAHALRQVGVRDVSALVLARAE